MINLSQMFNGSFRVGRDIYGTFSKHNGDNTSISGSILVEKPGQLFSGTFNVQIHPPDMQMPPTMPGMQMTPTMPGMQMTPTMPGMQMTPTMHGMQMTLPMPGMQMPPLMPVMQMPPPMPVMQMTPIEMLIQPGLQGTFSVNVTFPEANLWQPANGDFLVDVEGQPYKGSFSLNFMDLFRGTFRVEHQFPETMEQSWRTLLSKEIVNKDFLKLHDMIEYVRKNNVVVYPPQELIWSWSEHCEVRGVKVVIIGQDPYPTEGKAHGLAFSIAPGEEVPKRCSLSNIFEAIKWDYEQLQLENPQSIISQFSVPNHGCLIGWARQGVLLLNTYLTLQKHHENSKLSIEDHNKFNKLIKEGWKAFTDQVIKHLSDNSTGIVFMLWGEDAKKKKKYIDEREHLVLLAVHPSPFPSCKSFKTCRHFSACNKWLWEHPIDWNDLPEI